MKTLKRLAHWLGRSYCKEVCRREYEDRGNRRGEHINERRIEYRFALQCLARTCPATVLDVGTGTTAFPSVLATCGFAVTAIDNVTDYWPGGMFNRHTHVIDDDIVKTSLNEQFDFITCISVLEHIEDCNAAVRNMFHLLTPGGHLVLTFPYNEHEYVDNVYERADAGYGKNVPYLCQVFSRKELEKWTEENSAVIVEQEFWEVFSGDFWTCGEWLDVPREVNDQGNHHLTCLLFRKNGVQQADRLPVNCRSAQDS